MSDDIPVLEYAPGAPRSMRKRVLLGAIAVCAAGAAIVVAGRAYRASQARMIPLGGIIAAPEVNWQPETSGAGAEGTAEVGSP